MLERESSEKVPQADGDDETCTLDVLEKYTGGKRKGYRELYIQPYKAKFFCLQARQKIKKFWSS